MVARSPPKAEAVGSSPTSVAFFLLYHASMYPTRLRSFFAYPRAAHLERQNVVLRDHFQESSVQLLLRDAFLESLYPYNMYDILG